MSEKFVSKAVDEKGVGLGGTSGMVTDDSETFRLDNLETVIVGETSMFAPVPLKSHTSFQTTTMKHSFCLGDFLTILPLLRFYSTDDRRTMSMEHQSKSTERVN
jgi:hypothetical protein